MPDRWITVGKWIGGLGGSLWIAVGLVDACVEAGGCGGYPSLLVEAVALSCLLVSLVGFHLRFRDEYGQFGTAASAITALGLLTSLVIAVTGWEGGMISLIFGYPTLVTGWIILGIVLLYTKTGSLPGALLLVFGLPIGLIAGYLALFVLVPVLDLSVDENILSSGPVIVYGIAWIMVTRSV